MPVMGRCSRSLVLACLWLAGSILVGSARESTVAVAQIPASRRGPLPAHADPSAAATQREKGGPRPSVPPPEVKALEKVAAYMVEGPDPAGKALREIGYQHVGMTEESWRSFTPYHKIETAYLSAERGSPGGGQRMLAMLSKSLAQEYDSAGHDPVFKRYQTQADSATPIVFARLSPSDDHRDSSRELTPEARRGIETLSRYCDSGQFGPRTILRDHFFLEDDHVVDILRTSRTNEEALKRGWQAAHEEVRHVGMKQLIAEIDHNYATARSAPEFQPWRDWELHKGNFESWFESKSVARNENLSLHAQSEFPLERVPKPEHDLTQFNRSFQELQQRLGPKRNCDRRGTVAVRSFRFGHPVLLQVDGFQTAGCARSHAEPGSQHRTGWRKLSRSRIAEFL